MDYNKYISKEIERPLSDDEVLKLCNNQANLMKYSDLHKYKNVDQVLGKYKACIILVETKKNFGHWCCLFKYPNSNTLEWYDSYAYKPDDELEFVEKDFKKNNNMSYPHLTKLLYGGSKKYNIEYNDKNNQSEESNISTCGRYVGMRLNLRNLNNKQFNKLLSGLSKKIKKSKDWTITVMSDILLKE